MIKACENKITPVVIYKFIYFMLYLLKSDKNIKILKFKKSNKKQYEPYKS